MTFPIQAGTNILVKNVSWDTDGDDVDLPTRLVLELDYRADDQQELDEIVSDQLSDEYGYCHFGFELDID